MGCVVSSVILSASRYRSLAGYNMVDPKRDPNESKSSMKRSGTPAKVAEMLPSPLGFRV